VRVIEMATSTFDKKIVIDKKAAEAIINSQKKSTVVKDSEVNKVLEELKRSKKKLRKPLSL
jgi:hypothetical protein